MNTIKRILLGASVVLFYVVGAAMIWGAFALVSTAFISIGV
jgi:hypothetical protein